MFKHRFATLLLAGCLAAPAAAQDPIAAARDLYVSARYDEALAMLNGLRPTGSANASTLKSIEQYRSLCLLALGRGDEAEAAIAAVISADPFYLPSEAEASPRVRTAFAEVRQRQLPEIARAVYAAAKSAFDRKEYVSSDRQFRDLLRLIDDPDMRGRAADLRVLAAGFLDLSLAAAAPPPAPAKAEPPSPPPAPAKPTRPANYIYNAEEPGIIPPVPVKQDVPRVSSSIMAQTRDRGLIELVIDEQGRVTNINLRIPIHPQYDTQLVAAARDWRYRPATLDGKPVKFRKAIQVTVEKR